MFIGGGVEEVKCVFLVSEMGNGNLGLLGV